MLYSLVLFLTWLVLFLSLVYFSRFWRSQLFTCYISYLSHVASFLIYRVTIEIFFSFYKFEPSCHGAKVSNSTLLFAANRILYCLEWSDSWLQESSRWFLLVICCRHDTLINCSVMFQTAASQTVQSQWFSIGSVPSATAESVNGFLNHISMKFGRTVLAYIINMVDGNVSFSTVNYVSLV